MSATPTSSALAAGTCWRPALAQRYDQARDQSLALAAPLSVEDQGVQSARDGAC